MLTCFGCGKDLFDSVHTYVNGKQHKFCKGRSGPKKSCITKALYAMYQDGGCTFCGKVIGGFSGHKNHGLCRSCYADIHYGQEHRGTQKKTVLETRLSTITGLVAAISNYERIGVAWTGTDWPFGIVSDSVDATILCNALRYMWTSAVQIARAEGFLEGSNLLSRLNTSEASLSELTEKTENSYKTIARKKEELQELSKKAVDAASAIMTTTTGKP